MLITFWSASTGTKSVISALNVAYGTRSSAVSSASSSSDSA